MPPSEPAPQRQAPACEAAEAAYARLAASRGAGRIQATAALLLAVFDDFYERLCAMPYRAQVAFEQRDLDTSLRLSRERIGLYSRYVVEHGPRLRALHPELSEDAPLWDRVDAAYMAMIVDRYEADIAFSFAHSVRRNICHGLWRPVAYSFPPPNRRRALSLASVFRRLPVGTQIDAPLVLQALEAPGFTAPFRDAAGDARRILQRLERVFAPADTGPARLPKALDVVQAGFFRERLAFLVARWVMPDGGFQPFVVAFRNGPEGVFVDGVVHRTPDVHNLFSSTLANFHVTTRLYYQTCVFLHSIMPLRPLGHQYSTIGFNHVGKVAIIEEIAEQMRRSGQRFTRSPGATGTVALGFTFQACSYHLKVIRDSPTRSYKWGRYPGVAAVLDKYRVVHEINRAGSMLDAVLYFNLRLDRAMFEPDLLEEIREQAAGSVQVDDDGVLLRSLVVQLKIVPLPVYLETASEAEIEAAMASLGDCIRNNAATNIFNRDLDSRNYGVGRYRRVLLFDYDAVEKLADVKIRTNLDREPGEETVPGWFFEDGVIFLPEEIEAGLCLKSPYARRCFRRLNPELTGVAYWEQVQRMLQRGEAPELSVYPEECRLDGDGDGGVAGR
jgi:isocitrate dehydrogenase kinase/phosphatase